LNTDNCKYFIFYKPYNVLNQFSKERAEHITLADFMDVEKDVYPVGRLDKDSEGLLILTNDTSLNAALLSPSKKHSRSYFVQVDDEITDTAIRKVSEGVTIKLDTGEYLTKACRVKKLIKPPVLPERNPPVRFRQNIPTSWALIELTEGKNRQIRKMFASVGFPVLRLVRIQIEDLKIGKLEPGKYIEITGEELFKLLKIDPSSKSAGSKRSPTPGVKKSTSKEQNNSSQPASKFWSNKSSSKTFKNKPTTKPSKKSDNKR